MLFEMTQVSRTYRTTLPALPALVATMLFLLLAPPMPAEQRVFTSAQGKEVIAEIVSAKGDIVVLKMEGRTMETSISIYSPADQAYIRKWMKDNPAPIDYNLVIETSKKKIGRISKPTGYYDLRQGTWAYYITVENRSRDTTAGLTLEYRIFKENNVSKGYPRRPREINEKKGSIKIPDLVTNRSAAVTTDTFVLSEISYDATSDYADKLIGILLRILDSDGKVVAEFKEGSLEITRKTWEDPKKKPGPSASVN